jgi:hypothetical protein
MQDWSVRKFRHTAGDFSVRFCSSPMFDDRRWPSRAEPRVGRMGFQTIWIFAEGIRGRDAELGFSIRDPDREGRIPEMRDALAVPDLLDFKKGRKNLIFGS